VPDATFATPDVTTFCRLDELGLVVVGQHLQPDRAVLACRVADDAVEEADRWCRRCGCEGRPRDTVTRRLAHEPLGWRPTTLLLTIRRYRCTGCGHVWCQDTSRAAGPRAKLTRTALRWALVGLVRQHLSAYRAAFPDLVTSVEDVVAEGDRVVVRGTDRGTHQGDFMGRAASGRLVTTTWTEIFRMESGKAVEGWVETDTKGLMDQLGS
jgi:predicted ester cyclase